MRWIWTWLLGLSVSLSGGCALSSAQPGARRAATAPYTRRAETTNGTISLEVALRRFAAAQPGSPAIWLVGVTHLGTSNYYARLQQFLDRQDLVLFEGIGATNKQFRSVEAEGFSLQPALAKALGLRFQLTTIDYDRTNWVNSDLSVAELMRRLPADDQSGGFQQLMSLFEGEGAFGGIAKLGVGLLALSPRLQATAKLMLIETLAGFDGRMPETAEMGLEVESLMRVLIEDRNAVVIRDLRRAMARGSTARSVAIFYGAGHMPDLEKRLRRELRLKPVEDQWLRAFGVNPDRAGLTPFEVEALQDSVRQGLASPPAGAHGSDRPSPAPHSRSGR